jgi:hypothetical protein
MALDLVPGEKVVRGLLIYTGLRVSALCSIKLGDTSYAQPVATDANGGPVSFGSVNVHSRIAVAWSKYM